MKIEFLNIHKEELKKRKEILDELLKMDFSSLEFNEENIEKAREMLYKYERVTEANWKLRHAELRVATSDDRIIATLR